jgi:hypothetical protein
MTDFQTFSGYFYVFQVGNTLKTVLEWLHQKWDFLVNFANFSHNLWSKNHVLKKVGRGSSHDLFSNWYFLNLHALGYLKPVTGFFVPDFWVNKSLSMMCSAWPKSARTSDVKQCDCLKHYLCMATWSRQSWQLGLTVWTNWENCLKSAFLLSRTPRAAGQQLILPIQFRLSDFGLWRQLKVESEIKSPWTLKTILNYIKTILKYIYLSIKYVFKDLKLHLVLKSINGSILSRIE